MTNVLKDMVRVSQIEQIIVASTEFLTQTPWSDEELNFKKLVPDQWLFNWEVPAWVECLGINREFTEPIEEPGLKIIFEQVSKSITAARLEVLKNQPIKDFDQLITTKYPDMRFCIEPFFEQGTMNMVSAPPNTFKSWLFFLMAYNIANGTSFLNNFKTEQSNVLIVNEEDTERLIADRFRSLEIDQRGLKVFFHTAQGSKIDVKFCQYIITECQKRDIKVVMFDSLRSLHNAEENSSTEMQPIMDNLKLLTREGLTVIFTHHHKKKSAFDKGTDSESSRGSSAINAAVSGHITLEEVTKDDGEKRIVVKHLKSKVTQKIEPFEILVTTDPEKNTVGFTYAGEFKNALRLADQAKDLVFEAIKREDRWLSVKNLVEMGVAKERYVKTALTALVNVGLAEKTTRKELDEKYGEEKFSGTGKTNYYRWTKVEEIPEEGNIFDHA